MPAGANFAPAFLRLHPNGGKIALLLLQLDGN